MGWLFWIVHIGQGCKQHSWHYSFSLNRYFNSFVLSVHCSNRAPERANDNIANLLLFLSVPRHPDWYCATWIRPRMSHATSHSALTPLWQLTEVVCLSTAQIKMVPSSLAYFPVENERSQMLNVLWFPGTIEGPRDLPDEQVCMKCVMREWRQWG